ncbi:MAG: 2-dehydropantoate 2-reductase [Armatimonadetes bacterium]|nr:2-dehydropantoate 2-reductase [Armatimonadota bacterium]
MKIAVLGAGAMGSLFGGHLAEAGEDVTLIDVWREGVDALNAGGVRLEEKSGETRAIPVRATTDPMEVGPVDLVLVFVKCYHTAEAVRSAAPMIGPETAVLTLQNGWGNAPRIAEVAGEERVMAGITYHSATVLGPAHIQHAGRGITYIGELDGILSERLKRIADTFNAAGIETTPTDEVLKEIWSKLALNVCTLPTSALLRFTAGELVEHEGILNLMRGLLQEAVAVASAQRIPLDFDERWEAITGLLRRAAGAKASMLQDVEKRRRTEIDVINGAIVEAGKQLNLPTPHNEAMVWMVKALEETF